MDRRRHHLVVPLMASLLCAEVPHVAWASDSDKTVIVVGSSNQVLSVLPPTPMPTPQPSDNLGICPTLTPSGPDQFCVNIDAKGVSVAVKFSEVPRAPAQISCARLFKLSDPAKLERRLILEVRLDKVLVECDVSDSFLVAQSVESALPGVLGGATLTTIAVPWNRLHPRPRGGALNVSVYSTTKHKVFTYSYNTTLDIEPQTVAVAARYAPYARLVTPMPSPGAAAAPLRLRAIGADFAVLPNIFNMFTAAGLQNDANVSTQKALAQITKFAPVPLPTDPAQPLVPQTLQTRLQPQFAYPGPSGGLVDPNLKPLFDTTPFAIQSVSTLNSGAAYTYVNDYLSATALYAVKEAGGYVKAYNIVYTQPVATPSPIPIPTPTPAPSIQRLQQQIPSTYGTVPDAAFMPTTVSVQYADVVSKGILDRVGAVAFDVNAYQPVKPHQNDVDHPESTYRSTTVHVLGNLAEDENAQARPGARAGSLASAYHAFLGESAAYTYATGVGHFLQLRETAGIQLDDAFFAPSAGMTTYVAPLSGPVVHAGATVGNGEQKPRIMSIDVVGYRLTDAYGDVATNESWQVALPVADTPAVLLAGSQTTSLSDRIAILQQGLVTSYGSLLVPLLTSSGSALPVTTRPQYQRFVALTQSFPLGKTEMQLTAGVQSGIGTACTAQKGAGAQFACTTAGNSNFTWGTTFKHPASGFQAGIATTSATTPAVFSASSAVRYFGPLSTSPGSITSFISYTKCVQLTAGYTNTAFVQGSSIPQRGSTLAAQLDLPYGDVAVSIGLVNSRTSAVAQVQPSAVYVLLHGMSQTGPRRSRCVGLPSVLASNGKS
ncbi:MAG: hypothetical protein JO036_10925 [Candidatus Eremiobacteraeota bacterium]|nr:hypothetical protein [Candidatus Eremiobacteraeota bacterium]